MSEPLLAYRRHLTQWFMSERRLNVEGLTPWQVEHGSLAANHAWHRNGARGVPGQYKPASTQAGDTATVYGGAGNLARLAVTLRTAPMPRSASATASIGYGSSISDRGDGFLASSAVHPSGFSRQPIVAKRGVSVSM